MKNNFQNEKFWSSIKEDVLESIPTVPEGVGRYNDWLFILTTAKQAGYSIDEVQDWNNWTNANGDPEPTDDKWDDLPNTADEDLEDEDLVLQARKKLVSLAMKHGYVLPGAGDGSGYTGTFNFEHFTPSAISAPGQNISWHDYIPGNAESRAAAAERGLAMIKRLFPDEEGKICYTIGRKQKDGKVIPGEPKFITQKNIDLEMLSATFFTKEDGAYWLLNPVNKPRFDEYKKSKAAEGKQAGILQEHISTFKYFFIECDSISIEDQKRKIESMDLPWIGIVHSGGKSLHVIIRLDASSKKEFAERLKIIHHYCELQNFDYDKSDKNCNKWTRFPGAGRGKSLQYVIAINEDEYSFADWLAKHAEELQEPETVITQEGKETINFFNGDKINPQKLIEYIEANGYKSFIEYPEDEKAVIEYLKIDGKFVKKVDLSIVKNEISNLIRIEFPDKYSVYLDSGKASKSVIYDGLQQAQVSFIRDTKETVYLYYQNGILEVTKDDCKLVPYDTLSGYIWKDTVIPRDYHFSEDEEGFTKRFCSDVMSDTTEDGYRANDQRLNILRSTIGYLLSTYKERSCAKAVILTEKEAGEGENRGRSGKGIIIQALEKMRYHQTGHIDGRTLDKDGGRFDFANYQSKQTIYCLDDLVEGYDFPNLYSKITDTFVYEKKNVDKKEVPFEQSPKIICTTNSYPQHIIDESSRGRSQIIELENFFNAEHTPLQEYGIQLFDDYTPDEWAKHDAFMIRCIQIFLKEGLPEAKQSAAYYQKIIEQTTNITVFNFLTKWNRNKILNAERENWYCKADVFTEYQGFCNDRPKSIQKQSSFFR